MILHNTNEDVLIAKVLGTYYVEGEELGQTLCGWAWDRGAEWAEDVDDLEFSLAMAEDDV